MLRPSKLNVNARSPLVAAASMAVEQLEGRSLFSTAAVIASASAPAVHANQGEIIQADFSASAAVTGWTINWGDGTHGHLPANRSHATHTYASAGVYSATFLPTAPGASAAAATVAYTIDNVAPDIAITGAADSGDEGSPVTLGSTVNDSDSPADRIYGWTVYRDGKHFIVADGTDITSQNFTFIPTDNGNYVARLTVLDGHGGSTTVRSTPIAIANVAPAITIDDEPTAPVSEGDSVHLTTAMTDPGANDAHWYEWSIQKDGQPWTPPAETRLDSNGLVFTPTDNGTYIATLTVHDLDGGETTAASQPIVVLNAAPAVTISGAPESTDEGSTIALTATVTDPGVNDTQSYAWSVTKDGQPYTLASDVDLDNSSFTFVPDDNGQYVTTLTVTDSDGAATTVHTNNIAVANVAPVANISGVDVANEGDVVSISASATDAGSVDTLTYAWQITRNGESAVLAGNMQGSPDIQFPVSSPGSYIFTATVRDGDGGVTQVSHTVAVAYVAPTVTVAGPGDHAGMGEMLNYTSATIDPGHVVQTYAWSVQRDGVTISLPGDVATDLPTLSFAALDAGSYTASLTINDGQGGTVTAASDVTHVIGLLV